MEIAAEAGLLVAATASAAPSSNATRNPKQPTAPPRQSLLSPRCQTPPPEARPTKRQRPTGSARGTVSRIARRPWKPLNVAISRRPTRAPLAPELIWGRTSGLANLSIEYNHHHLALGNKISSLFIDLPVSDQDPVRRYRETAAAAQALKSDPHNAEGTTAVLEIAGLAPPIIHSTIAQALYATRLFNITITNVPGPQQTLYAFGCPMREVQPLVPLAAQHALGVAIVSYDGDAFFGVIADRDGVPDLDVMLDALRDAVKELGAAAGVHEDSPVYIRPDPA